MESLSTTKEILEQQYITAKDIRKIMPVSYDKSIEYIKELREEMRQKGYFVPDSREYVALTKLFKKKFGL